MFGRMSFVVVDRFLAAIMSHVLGGSCGDVFGDRFRRQKFGDSFRLRVSVTIFRFLSPARGV